MAKKIEKECYEKISGGRLWGTNEELYFIRLIQSETYGALDNIDFEALATDLNRKFRNNRTPSACKARFRTMRKKAQIDIEF